MEAVDTEPAYQQHFEHDLGSSSSSSNLSDLSTEGASAWSFFAPRRQDQTEGQITGKAVNKSLTQPGNLEINPQDAPLPWRNRRSQTQAQGQQLQTINPPSREGHWRQQTPPAPPPESLQQQRQAVPSENVLPPLPSKPIPANITALMTSRAPLNDLLECSSVWELSNSERCTLHAYLLKLQHSDLIRRIKHLAQQAADNQEELQVGGYVLESKQQCLHMCACMSASKLA